MKKIKAKYVDGVIVLPDDFKVKGERDVYVVFPDEIEVKSVSVRDLVKAVANKVNIGGDAIKDCEDIYNE